MLNDLLALYGAVYLVHRDFELSEVGFILVDLGEVSRGLVDNSDCSTQSLLRRTRLRLLFLHFALRLGSSF